MGFKDELRDFHGVIQRLQANNEINKELVDEEDVLAALIILNFIDYKKVPDLFLGCASLNLLSTYIKQQNSKINYQFRRHILSVLKGIEDVQQPKSVKVTFDPSDGLSLLIISFWGFQFSFQSQRFTQQIQRISSRIPQTWDGIRKQVCAKTIFEFARFNDWISNKTLGGENLLEMIDRETSCFYNGGFKFDNGKLLKVKDLKPAIDEKDLYLKNYVRGKLYECQDRPVIISAVFRRIWEKHITFTSVKPYIPNTRVITICDHINLYRPDVEKVIDINTLQLKQRYYIIGFCKPYKNADRMGVQLAIDKGYVPIFHMLDFSDMPRDILSECHRFSIEEYLSGDQKFIKL